MDYQPWVHNPHWIKDDPKLSEAAAQPVQFMHTKLLAEAIDIHPSGILFVRGPRQVGKSTFLRQFIQKCLKSDISPESIILYDAERFGDRHHLLGELEAFLETKNSYCIILIDELTSIDQWWLSIKLLADQGKIQKALFIGTGSSSLDLAQGADLMPGRRGRRHPVDFEILPIPFRMVQDRLLIEEYLLTGGFPWAINEYLRFGTIPAYVYELYASWIKGAFHKQRHQVDHLPFLLHQLISTQGTPVSVQKIARDCGIGSNNTAETFIGLLQKIYALLPTSWMPPSGGAFAPRKNRKFYPFDPFLYHLFADFEKGWETAFEAAKNRLSNPAEIGLMVEGLVAAELRHRQPTLRMGYWTGKKEIDFIGKSCIEVKYQNHVTIEEFTWTEKILSPDQTLIVITKKDNAKKGNIQLVDIKRWLTSPAQS
jgi:uncharacterized protein